MIKCIATDMDGTLLNSSQEVSTRNKEAVFMAQAQGIEVVVATGRSYQEATDALDEAGLNCPVIAVNGAEVRSKEGQIISSIFIDKQLAISVAKRLLEMEIYFEVYTNDGRYTDDSDKAISILVDVIVSANRDVNVQEATASARKRFHEGRIHVIDTYDRLFRDENSQIFKFLVFSFDSEKLEAVSMELGEFKELTVSSSGYENLEITHINAQKGVALEAFVKARGIDLSETMALGDNFNDVSMFERVGRAVAMGNAGDTIKSLCDFVTSTNEEDGVAQAIMQILTD